MFLTTHGGVQFVAYEFLKEQFGSYHRAKKDSGGVMRRLELSLGYLAMGAVSKIIASTVTYPLQVVKSRLQQRSNAVEMTLTGEVATVKRNYRGVIDCVTKIWQREGIHGFFKGCLTNALRVAPSSAITFVVYESIMDAFSS